MRWLFDLFWVECFFYYYLWFHWFFLLVLIFWTGYFNFWFTFQFASGLFLNPSISSISLISLLVYSFTSTWGLTGKLFERGLLRSTYLFGVRSVASISRTGWSKIWLPELINSIKSCFLNHEYFFESEPFCLRSYFWNFFVFHFFKLHKNKYFLKLRTHYQNGNKFNSNRRKRNQGSC